MNKTELTIEKISTNHLLEEAKYTVLNAVRNQSGNYEGQELSPSSILFYFLGRNYYLKEESVYDDEGICILQNYRRHFEKDGKIYLESKDNALYRFSKNSPVIQQHKHALYNENKTFYNSITKQNIPFIGQGEEISYVNNKGDIFLINMRESYYWICSADGRKKDKIVLDSEIPVYEKIFFLKAKIGLEFILSKEGQLFHYRIDDEELILLTEYSPPTLPLNMDYVDNVLFFFVKEEEKYYLLNTETKEKTEIIPDFIAEIEKKLKGDFPYYKGITKYTISSRVVTILIGNSENGFEQHYTVYSQGHSIAMNFETFKFDCKQSNLISKFIDNKLVLFLELILNYHKLFVTENTTNKRYLVKVYRTGIETIMEYDNLKETTVNTRKENVENLIIDCAVSFNVGTGKYETVHLESAKFDNVDVEKCFCCLGENGVTIEYIEKKEEEEKYQNKLISFSANYPADFKDKLLEFIDHDIFFEVKKRDVGLDFKQGQDHLMLGYLMKKDGLEFMHGNIYFTKWTGYGSENKQDSYEGERSLSLVWKDHNDKEAWRMYSPPVLFNKEVLMYCNDLPNGIDDKVEIFPVALPRYSTYSTSGQYVFFVDEEEETSIQVCDNSKKITNEFIAINDSIEEIEATANATFVGGKNTLQILTTRPVGDKIQFQIEPVKFDDVVDNIGEELIFFYGNGFIHYVRENKLVSDIWRLKEEPIKALKMKNNIVIQTTDKRIWVLTMRTGEISLLSYSEEKELELDYQIRDKDGKGYFLKAGNPSFRFSWSQAILRRIRAIESFSEITGGKVGEQQGGVVVIKDKFRLNLRGILNENTEVLVEFKDKIAKNIIIETF